MPGLLILKVGGSVRTCGLIDAAKQKAALVLKDRAVEFFDDFETGETFGARGRKIAGVNCGLGEKEMANCGFVAQQ